MGLKRSFDNLTPAVERWKRFPISWSFKAPKLMLAIGALLSKESQRRAPILKGDLEASHRVILTRRQLDSMSVTVQVGDAKTEKYIDFIHESSYNLGPLSQRKAAADTSVVVGPKFLERALDEIEEEALKRIGDELFGTIK